MAAKKKYVLKLHNAIAAEPVRLDPPDEPGQWAIHSWQLRTPAQQVVALWEADEVAGPPDQERGEQLLKQIG